MIVYNNQAPDAVNNVGQFGATEGSIGAYKQAAEYAADAKYWALLSQTKYNTVEDIMSEVERLYAQGILLESDIEELKKDFEQQQQILLGLVQTTSTAIDNTNAATELSREATQKVLDQLNIISNMSVTTTLLPPGSLSTGSYDNDTGVFSFGIPEGQPGRDGTDGTISDINTVPIAVPVSTDYGFFVDQTSGGLYRASMSDIANLVPSIRSISINGEAPQTGEVSFNSVSSFKGRFGDVTPTSGDYDVTQITNAAKSGDNSDITSLSGLTTALSLSQGGTGATTAEAARANLGLGSTAVDSIIPIPKGGTGATTADVARSNLGLGLVAVESIVPVSKGGTGSSSASAARLALVAAKSGDNSDITSFTNKVTFTQPVSIANAVSDDEALSLGQSKDWFQSKPFIPVIGKTFTTGGTLSSSNESLYDEVTGLYWVSNTTPRVVTPGTSPVGDSSFFAVGKLSSLYDFNDSRNWFDPSSSVDNTIQARAFLSTMTKYKLKAIFVGDVLTSSRIQFDCDLDASGCTWHISSESDSSLVGGGGAVLLLRDVDTVESTGNEFATSRIGQLSHDQLQGPLYANSTVGVIGEGDINRAYLRNGSSYTNSIDLYVMDGGTGNHPDTPALFQFHGTSKFIVRPLRPLREIKGPRFVMTGPLSGSRVVRACFKIERNNTTLDGGCFDAQSDGILAESYVEPGFVTGCTIKNVSMPSSQSSAATYVIQSIGTNRLTVQNCHSPSGWALIDGNFMRNTVVEDSSGGTIGGHAMVWNLTVNRCKVTPVIVSGRYQGGISLTGGGLLSINDYEYDYRGGPRQYDHPVATRGDYGQAWEGDININNIKVNMRSSVPAGESMSLLYLQGAVAASVDLTRDCYLGKRININGVAINITNTAWTASDVRINTAFFQTTGTQNVVYPSEYNVSNFEVYKGGMPTSEFTLDCRWLLLMAGSYVKPSTCSMIFDNIRWPTTSVGYIGPAASTSYVVTPNLVISNSKGTFYCNQFALSAGGRFTIKNSTIGNLTLGNGNGGGMYTIDKCFIRGKCGGSPGSSDAAYYYNNHITVTSGVEIGSIAKYCFGNTVIASGSIVGRSIDEWFSYRDPTIFRTA